MSSDKVVPDISIIVPTHKVNDILIQCISQINLHRSKNLELIVVIDGVRPTDEDYFISRTDRLIVLGTQFGASYARNVGAKVARSEIILFIDSDVLILPNTIEMCLSHFEDPYITAVFGSYTAHTRSLGRITAFKNFQHHFTHQTSAKRAATFWTGCGAIRKSAFQDINGFDTNLCFCEDIDLGYRLNLKGKFILVDPEMQVEHLKTYTIFTWFRSELVGRAIPWSRLLHKYHSYQNDMNIKYSHVISTFFATSSLICIFASFFSYHYLIPFVAFQFAICFLNRYFLFKAVRINGIIFALFTLALLQLHYFIAALGFVIVSLEMQVNRLCYKKE